MPLYRRIANLFSRAKVEREIDAELLSHIELRTEDNMAAGMSPAAARRDALLRFGNPVVMKEKVSCADLLFALETMWRDFLQALRGARRSPKFASVAIMTLALGIGATATVYSVVHAVLIDPYPYRGAERMVHLHLYDKEPVPYDLALTGSQFEQFRKSPVLDGAIAEDMFSMSMTGQALPEQVQAGRISPDGFGYFGVAPLLGRAFTPVDPAKVAVLSYHYWKSHYAGRSDVLGNAIQLDHENYTILGVMPQRFAWTGRDVYVPLQYSSDPNRMANVFARVKSGVSDQAAEQALQPVLDAFAKDTPGHFPQNFKVHLVRINELAVGRFSGILVLLLISVSFLLVLACVNVSILLLARGEARRPEMAMRKALGASRGRMISQLLAEALLLAMIGGAVGVVLALAGVQIVRHFLPQSVFPAEAEIKLNLPVLCFSAGVSMLMGILAGLWPALRLSRATLRDGAEAGSSRIVGQRGVRRTHLILLACQVALTVMLLACSGATLKELARLLHTSLGYDPRHLISVNLTLRDGAYSQWAQRIEFYEQVREKIARDPDVVSAAIAESNLPPAVHDGVPLSIPGLDSGASQTVIPQRVDGNYFEALHIPILQGRVWNASETAHASGMVLINAAMQRRYWPHRSPLGQTIVLNNGVVAGNVWTLVAPGNHNRFQIIGVVGDTPNQGLDEQPAPGVYLPYTATPYDWFNLTIRTRGDSPGLLQRIKERVHEIDSSQAVGDVTTADELLESDSLGRERFVADLFTGFAFLALSFAASGLYSILSYVVAQRTNEFGLRIALGAKRRDIVGLVTRSAFVAVLTGIAAGLVVDVSCSHLITDWTYGNVHDPAMLVFTILTLLAVAALAASIPAWIAAAIDPMQALRSE